MLHYTQNRDAYAYATKLYICAGPLLSRLSLQLSIWHEADGLVVFVVGLTVCGLRVRTEVSMV